MISLAHELFMSEYYTLTLIATWPIHRIPEASKMSVEGENLSEGFRRP